MQVALKAAASDLARSVSSALVVWAACPACPDCTPTYKCEPVLKCPAPAPCPASPSCTCYPQTVQISGFSILTLGLVAALFFLIGFIIGASAGRRSVLPTVVPGTAVSTRPPKDLSGDDSITECELIKQASEQAKAAARRNGVGGR